MSLRYVCKPEKSCVNKHSVLELHNNTMNSILNNLLYYKELDESHAEITVSDYKKANRNKLERRVTQELNIIKQNLCTDEIMSHNVLCHNY